MRTGPSLLRLLSCIIIILPLAFTACKQQTPAQEECDGEENAPFEIEGANAYEFNLLKDPRTGKIPDGIHEQELAEARSTLSRQLREGRMTNNIYQSQGPNNLGGRTRSVVYDIRYNGAANQVVMAGGVSGGLFKSADDGASWTRKSPTSAIYSVTSIAQDTRPGHQNTWYYGTGEVLGGNELTAAPMQGDGIFKSNNNGETWQKLAQSNTGSYESFDKREDCIWRVVVNPANGDVYMAAAGGIFRSADGGSSWNLVISGTGNSFNALQSTDIAITSTGRIYAAFDGFNTGDVDGVWTSLTGSTGSWTRIAGVGAGGSPAGWDAENNYGRIILAIAPANENLMYALVKSSNTGCPNLQAKLFCWNLANASWTNLTANLPGCSGGPGLFLQGGYNMTLAVRPDNANVLYVGGSVLYRSTDGFTTPGNVTEMTGHALDHALHADVHCLAFKPTDAATMICGNDGGLQRGMDNLTADVSWNSLNNHYSTIQFYQVALDPRPGNDKVIGGAQDNGTSRNTSGSGGTFEMVYGGDGVSVGLSQPVGGTCYEYGGYQYGNIFRRNASWGNGSATDIRPSSATGLGLFVTLFHLDPDNTELLYYANGNRLFRNTSASTAMPFNWTEMSGAGSVTASSDAITALATTRGGYNAENSSLFFGNNNGQLYRLDDPANASGSKIPVNISGANFPAYATLSSIAVNPRNDDTVIVTFSNYGSWVTNIWWTGNAKSATPTWVNVEHNLSLPSVRSSAIAATESGVQYFVGTSVGLYRSGDPLNIDWSQEAADQVGNAVVSAIRIRPADNRLLVGTYGNAMWTTNLSQVSNAPLPVTLSDFNGKLQSNHTLLEWKTSNEANMNRFEIWRSYDGLSFQKIGVVPPLGNSAALHTYQYLDKEPALQKNYYRLNMLDLDGHSRLSDIVLVRRDPGPQQLYVTNPFYGQLDLRFAEIPAGRIRIGLYDLSGRQIVARSFDNLAQAQLRFDPGIALGTGMYLLRVDAGDQSFSVKVMKHQ